MRVKKIDRTKAVADHLKRYKSIDRLTAMQLYRIWDLPSAIRRLRNKGLTIECISGSGSIGKYQIIE